MKKTEICPVCESEMSEFVHSYTSSVLGKTDGQPIVVPNVKSIKCQNPGCGYMRLPEEEEVKIDRYVEKESRDLLNPEEIALIRKSLGFSTKTQASEFLGLNSKAFTKWENGYNPMNVSNDLLLRLVAFSRKNFDFVKNLHQTHFRFDPTDYQMICSSQNVEWKFKEEIAIGTYQQSNPQLQKNNLYHMRPRSAQDQPVYRSGTGGGT